MGRWSRIFAIAIIGIIFSTAAVAEDKQTKCRKCNMQINESDKKFSVIMPKVPGMEGSEFDDIGCAIKFRNGECATRQSNFDSNAFTFDYSTGEQIPMEKTFFAVGAGIDTPMGYDIVPFKDKTAAEKLVAENKKGSVVKLFELVDMTLK